MQTPTADLTDRPERTPCGCSLFQLCTQCFAREQKRAAEAGLQEWAETYGAREVRAERRRPVLRVVR